jgi:hypothetical protein
MLFHPRSAIALLSGINHDGAGIMGAVDFSSVPGPSSDKGDGFRMSRLFKGPGIALGFCLLTLAPAVGRAARQPSNTPAPSVDVEKVGPRVGDAVPEFSLRDQGGRIRSLKSLLGPKGAVIVFFRSADW